VKEEGEGGGKWNRAEERRRDESGEKIGAERDAWPQ
jgi:hypothetical protein